MVAKFAFSHGWWGSKQTRNPPWSHKPNQTQNSPRNRSQKRPYWSFRLEERSKLRKAGSAHYSTYSELEARALAFFDLNGEFRYLGPVGRGDVDRAGSLLSFQGFKDTDEDFLPLVFYDYKAAHMRKKMGFNI